MVNVVPFPIAKHVSEQATERSRPALFLALGKSEPPLEVQIDGLTYRRVEIFKHDSWAATALYQGPRGLIVCKFHRQAPVGFLSMRWLGNYLAQHETHILRTLSDLPNIPAWSGDVYVNGKRLRNAIAHEYVPGHPLASKEMLPASFFDELEKVLVVLHQRDMAYVDLHKRENVLVGDNGRPYLIDFQISFVLAHWWPIKSIFTRALLQLLQQSDMYHLAKHRAKCEIGLKVGTSSVVPPPWWIRAHRLIGNPFRKFRRGLLVKLGIRDKSGRSSSEAKPEIAFQTPSRHAA